jgi:thiol-disulfide isomerase/thioredoxin
MNTQQFSLKSLVALSIVVGSLFGTLQAESQYPIEVVIISATGCPPCKKLAAEVGKLKLTENSQMRIRTFYWPSAEAKQWAQRAGVSIKGTPTILIFANDRYVYSACGYMSAQQLLSEIQRIAQAQGIQLA